MKSAGTGAPLLPSRLRSLVALVGVTTLTFFTFSQSKVQSDYLTV